MDGALKQVNNANLGMVRCLSMRPRLCYTDVVHNCL